jgi:hypothetical protein
VVLCPDVAPCMDSRLDCRDLLQRSVIHYESEREASSAIISAPIQGVTTGTVASVSRGPSEDRKLRPCLHPGRGFYIGPHQLAAFIVAARVKPKPSLSSSPWMRGARMEFSVHTTQRKLFLPAERANYRFLFFAKITFQLSL